MNALRYFYTVEQNRIVIDLPPDFNYKSVEVILLPIEKAKLTEASELDFSDKKERLKELLSIGQWSENDFQPFIDTQKLINQWKIEKF
jgi:hypothetical protein